MKNRLLDLLSTIACIVFAHAEWFLALLMVAGIAGGVHLLHVGLEQTSQTMQALPLPVITPTHPSAAAPATSVQLGQEKWCPLQDYGKPSC